MIDTTYIYTKTDKLSWEVNNYIISDYRKLY